MTPVRFQVFHAGWAAAVLVLGALTLLLAWLSRRAWPAHDWASWAAPALKLAALILLLAMLLNPVVTGTVARKGANDFVVLVDGGQSMGLHAGQEFLGELRAAEKRPDSWLGRLEEDFRVARLVFTDRLRKWPEEGELSFDGCRSDLIHALEQVNQRFAWRPLAGAIVFSDGLITDAERIESMDLGFPVYPVICQAETALRDVAIAGVTVSASDFEDAPVTMAVSMRCENLRRGRLEVTVRDECGEQMARAEREIGGGGEEHAVQVRFRPLRPGVAAYRVEAVFQGEAEEATTANNTWMESIDPGRGPYRVLYVCGRPNWEHKFLSRAVAADPELQLVSLARVARREPKFVWRGRRGETGNPLFRGFQGQSPDGEPGHDQPVVIRLNTESAEELRSGFPRDREGLFGPYHAVVLDDLEAEFFTEEQQLLLEKFVSVRGGSLLMLGGQESLELGGYGRSTIGRMLPVCLDGAAGGPPIDGAKLELTREGWLEPWVRLRLTEAEEKKRLADMPAFRSVHRPGAVKPGAAVLALAVGERQGKVPVLVTQTFGEGRVAALLLGDLWRWGMEDEARRADLERWWRQVIRWLVADVPRFVQVETFWEDEHLASRAVQVRVRRQDFRPEENATVELRLREAGKEDTQPVRLFAEPSLKEPGLYQAQVSVTEPGAYRVEAQVTGEGGKQAGQGEAGWSWNPLGAELASLQARPDILRQLAAKTGGRLLRPNELDGFLRDLPRMEVPVRETRVRPLWHQPWLFLVVLAFLLGEWALRRWKGLA